ncbi:MULTISPECIES: hypothetical protein [Amycolatopsis]|uniref:Uncharacterized protein n=3 Tax=Amycolatopsis TaxID=1813 RepID=A0A3N2GZ26_9PSEU|nr:MULTISPECIES: hypothetical protein [Amycolatopsis]MCF6427102.1 hypothetical protein [Amycolatopsis tucumanensis]OXM60646.1 hypothetical protein CF166_35045 [Amycolatopsis sp. KNN50.9b]ROS41817.1 hypothetical protein EDD35_4188 [Amycolatopsis thermoflava]UQS27441.1 hypothetical protein L1857_33915 [Amycolatopsis thermalba]
MDTPAKTSPRKPFLMRLGIGVFAVGVLAVLAVFVLFAFGLRDLPVWLSAVAGVATPLGIALSLISLVREHRKAAAG